MSHAGSIIENQKKKSNMQQGEGGDTQSLQNMNNCCKIERTRIFPADDSNYLENWLPTGFRTWK